jgi:hypothetical protein
MTAAMTAAVTGANQKTPPLAAPVATSIGPLR